MKNEVMNKEEILKLIPHRPPILLVDRVEELEPGQRGVGCKEFTEDDPCFAGHFPGQPILPGVLMVEAIAQTALVVLLSGDRDEAGKTGRLGMLAKIENARFRSPITPGDSIRYEAIFKKKVGAFYFVSGRVTRASDGAECATCNVTVTMTDQ